MSIILDALSSILDKIYPKSTELIWDIIGVPRSLVKG